MEGDRWPLATCHTVLLELLLELLLGLLLLLLLLDLLLLLLVLLQNPTHNCKVLRSQSCESG